MSLGPLWGKNLYTSLLTKDTMGTSAFGVDNTFRNTLSVEVSYTYSENNVNYI